MFGPNPTFYLSTQLRGQRGHFFGFPVGNGPTRFVA